MISKNEFSVVEHPLANRQVQMVNNTIKLNLKKRLEKCKIALVEKLLKV